MSRLAHTCPQLYQCQALHDALRPAIEHSLEALSNYQEKVPDDVASFLERTDASSDASDKTGWSWSAMVATLAEQQNIMRQLPSRDPHCKEAVCPLDVLRGLVDRSAG